LPIRIDNRYRLTAWFILLFGSGFAIPFIAVRHQMLKK
jgi:cytochrome c oxidase subunit 7c